MTVPRLPTEIIQDIFKRLNQEDRWNTLYLYKKWYLSVKSIYFESVFWQTEEKVQRLKQHLTEVNKNSNGAHVFQQLTMTKRLCISDYGPFSAKFTAKEFLYLLSRFPNLRQLDIPSSGNLQYYMKILCECQTNELPQLLEDIVMKDYYCYGREEEDAIIQKLKTCYRFRQTLKRLTLANLGVDHGNRFIQLLPDFKNLDSLEIHNKTKPHLTLFHLLRACPSLSNIKYTSTFEVPRKTNQQLADRIYDLGWQDLSIESLDNLKKVELSIPKLTAPYIEFFTDHSPKSLDEVSINFTQIGMHEWIEDVTLDVALNLCRHLQRLKSVRLSFEGERCRDHGEINIFYEILNTLTGEKEFQTCSVYHSSNDDEEPIYVQPASIEINGSKLSHSYGYKTDKDKIFSLPTFSPSGLQQLQKITSFSIWMENKRNTFPDILHSYLEYVKRYMPKLSFFSIRGCTRCSSKGEFTASSPSGRHSLENMTNISLDNTKLSDSVMTDLSTYFPRTEVLEYNLWGTFKESHEVARINVSNLKYLNTLDISHDIIGFQHPGPIFITFLDRSRHKVYYLPEYRWRRKETVDYRFEPSSLDAMREVIASEKFSFSINIKGSDQLKQIKFSIRFMNINLIKANLVIE